jgi:SpoVK/Ycf46/Vps4 family AAA+-type ATPase
MANSDQILGLIKSHLTGDNERFHSLALQIAAGEAKAGHVFLSRSIKEVLDNQKLQGMRPQFKMINSEMSDLLMVQDSPYRLSDMVMKDALKSRINRIILEYIQRDKLHQHNLENRRKILLAGPSGTGKTMTASVIANELRLPLYVVRLEKIVTKFMGETGLKLSKVFDYMKQVQGVYLFDEFDAIGQRRGMDNEVGEMRRVLNSFLQMMERDDSDSIILAATNDLQCLDQALFRRFDDVLEYELPDEDEMLQILSMKFHNTPLKCNPHDLWEDMKQMSHAEICMVCTDALKEKLLYDRPLDMSLVREIIATKTKRYHIV